MKKVLFLLLIFSSLNTKIFATTYYVDAANGNDSNSGTSIAAPWKTIDKINNFSFNAGDSILLKRGDVWKEVLEFSSSGNAFQPIVIGSYGDGELPILTAIDVYEGWDSPFNWTDEGNNLWTRVLSYNPQRLWINGKEVLRNEIIDSLDGTRYVWGYEKGKIYIYSPTNPALAFHSMRTNVFQNVAKFIWQKYIILQDIELQGGYSFSLTIQGSANITIKNCKIGSYAREGIIIKQWGETSSAYITVENCIIDSKFKFSYGKDKGIDDAILIVAGANNCEIKNNIIKDFGHCSVYLKSLHGTDNGVYDNKIYGNFMSGKNVTYQRGIGTDGYENKCHDNEFFNNIITEMTVRNQINGNNNWIHHNIIDGTKNTIVKPFGAGQGIELQGYGAELVCHDNKIDNNLIMNCDEPGISFNHNGNPKYNNYIRNNIIYNCGRNSKEGYDNIGIKIDNNSRTIQNNYFYNNCIFSGNENLPSVFLRGSYLTAEQFNSIDNGLDLASNNIQKDPLIEIIDSLHYYITENSPCIDAGIDVGLLFDFYGNKIFSGNAPDIGIYEYQNPNSVLNGEKTLCDFSLSQNFPNPFNPSTTISYSLPKDGFVKLVVFNSIGQVIAELINEEQNNGKHYVIFNAKNFPSGVYFYRLETSNNSQVKKMLLVK